MTTPLVSSVRIEARGKHARVMVWIRGQSVGALLCGAEDAEALKNLLLIEHSWMVQDAEVDAELDAAERAP